MTNRIFIVFSNLSSKSLKSYSIINESRLQQTNGSRGMWQKTNDIVPYKAKSKTNAICDDPNLPDEFNAFYSRFDRVESILSKVPCNHPPPYVTDIKRTSRRTSILGTLETKRTISHLDMRKAMSSDCISTHLLSVCS